MVSTHKQYEKASMAKLTRKADSNTKNLTSLKESLRRSFSSSSNNAMSLWSVGDCYITIFLFWCRAWEMCINWSVLKPVHFRRFTNQEDFFRPIHFFPPPCLWGFAEIIDIRLLWLCVQDILVYVSYSMKYLIKFVVVLFYEKLLPYFEYSLKHPHFKSFDFIHKKVQSHT